MKKISHYSLERSLGTGGMGEVFLATDTSLGRKVALKLLPAQFSSDTLRLERFQKEARVVSALNHPNILTIFEISSADGQEFIVTEFIDGLTVRDRLARGALPILDVVDLGIGVLSALAEAHAAGVVHRDIKPENIMIRRDGLVKVLDFGLAKRTGPSTSEESATAIRQTAPGTVLGTVTYMSPEQARGLDVDARTDLFSLGAVLYEALTGHVPFEGATSTDILAAILHREPAPIPRYTSEVPRELQWFVEKALHKDRDERYQSAREMLSDLRRIRRDVDTATASADFRSDAPASAEAQHVSGPGPVAERRSISSAEYIISGIRTHKRGFAASIAGAAIIAVAAIYLTAGRAKAIESVAVLPFENASGNADTEYLADGLTENVINSLTGISELRVAPRSSVFRYKGSKLPVEDIAKQLGVRAVLTGRLQQRGQSVSVQAELVDVDARAQIWGERFEASINDVMSVERRLAQGAAEQLRPSMTRTEHAKVEKSITTDATAHDLYLKGRYLWNKRTAKDIYLAIDYFKRAIERDPGFAMAWQGLAEGYIVLPNYDPTVQAHDVYPKGREAAERALRIDPEMAEPHATVAGVLFEYEYQWAAAENEFRKAIELKPGFAAGHYWYADYLGAMGRHEEAIVHARAARKADPLSLIAATAVPYQLYLSGDFDGALREMAPIEELELGSWRTAMLRGTVALADGKREEAAKQLDVAAQGGLDQPRVQSLVLRGRRGEAEALARSLVGLAQQKRYSAYRTAGVYAILGDVDETVRWLNEAHAQRSGELPYIRNDFSFFAIWDDPRFVAAIQRMGLPTDVPRAARIRMSHR